MRVGQKIFFPLYAWCQGDFDIFVMVFYWELIFDDSYLVGRAPEGSFPLNIYHQISIPSKKPSQKCQNPPGTTRKREKRFFGPRAHEKMVIFLG